MRYTSVILGAFGVVASSYTPVLAEDDEMPTLPGVLSYLLEGPTQACLQGGGGMDMTRRLEDEIPVTYAAAAACAAAYPDAAEAFASVSECLFSDDMGDDMEGDDDDDQGDDNDDQGGDDDKGMMSNEENDKLVEEVIMPGLTTLLGGYILGDPQAQKDLRDVFGLDGVKELVEGLVESCLLDGGTIEGFFSMMFDGAVLPTEITALFTTGDALTVEQVGAALTKGLDLLALVGGDDEGGDDEGGDDEGGDDEGGDDEGGDDEGGDGDYDENEDDDMDIMGFLGSNACAMNSKTNVMALDMIFVNGTVCPCEAMSAHTVDDQAPSLDEELFKAVVHPDMKKLFAAVSKLLVNFVKYSYVEKPFFEGVCKLIDEELEAVTAPDKAVGMLAGEKCGKLLAPESKPLVDMVLDLALGYGASAGVKTECQTLSGFPCDGEDTFPLIPASTFADFENLFSRVRKLATDSGREELYGSPIQDFMMDAGEACEAKLNPPPKKTEAPTEESVAVGTYGSFPVATLISGVVAYLALK